MSLPLETVVREIIPNEFAEMQMIDVEGKKMPDSEFGNKRFIVLLVEDNVELLNLTRESLSDWFKVFSACNGKEALEILSRESIYVIVSDITINKDAEYPTHSIGATLNMTYISFYIFLLII